MGKTWSSNQNVRLLASCHSCLRLLCWLLAFASSSSLLTVVKRCGYLKSLSFYLAYRAALSHDICCPPFTFNMVNNAVLLPYNRYGCFFVDTVIHFLYSETFSAGDFSQNTVFTESHKPQRTITKQPSQQKCSVSSACVKASMTRWWCAAGQRCDFRSPGLWAETRLFLCKWRSRDAYRSGKWLFNARRRQTSESSTVSRCDSAPKQSTTCLRWCDRSVGHGKARQARGATAAPWTLFLIRVTSEYSFVLRAWLLVNDRWNPGCEMFACWWEQEEMCTQVPSFPLAIFSRTVWCKQTQ